MRTQKENNIKLIQSKHDKNAFVLADALEADGHKPPEKQGDCGWIKSDIQN